MITNMAQLQAVDAQTTPVVHNFTPASRVADNVARWVDREHNGGLPIGYRVVTMSVKDPTSNGGSYRVRVTLAMPKLDLTIPTAPKVVSIGRAIVEFVLPDTFDDQDCKDLVAMMNTLMTRGAVSQLGDNIVTKALPY